MIELNGITLTIEEVKRVARDCEPAEISQEACAAINHSRAHVEAMLKSGEAVYGLTTALASFRIRALRTKTRRNSSAT
jgi:histidine ammonia-lyase